MSGVTAFLIVSAAKGIGAVAGAAVGADATSGSAAQDDRVRRLRALYESRSRALEQAHADARARYGDRISSLPHAGADAFGQGPHADPDEWWRQAQEWLASAERRLAGEVADATAAEATARAVEENAAATADLAGRMGNSQDGPVGAGEALADAKRRLRETQQQAETARQEEQREEIRATLARVLGRLDAYVTESEREPVLAAAARAGQAPTLDEARTRVADVRIRVQEANKVATTRREAVEEAAELLCDLEDVDVEEAGPVRTELLEVRDGRRELDADLRDRARRLCEEAVARANRRYAQQAVVSELTALGYEVSSGFETLTAEDGVVRLSRPEWNEHEVAMRFDTDSDQVRSAVVRTAEGEGGDDQQRLDVERESQWCDSFQQARERLAAFGVETEVLVATEPGEVPVPVDTSSRQTGLMSHDESRERER